MESDTKIGFVGTGVMGKSMARNLMKKGYALSVFTRTKSKSDDLIQAGAEWKDTVAGLARSVDVIMTMVGFPNDVEEVYYGEDGILANAPEGTYIIDMTTSSPLLAEDIYKKAHANGQHVLDAPVSGGDVGAQNGSLTIMVGGDEADFKVLSPLFSALGENVIFQGPAGAGQHTKMSNQITIASNMVGVCEAMVYAKKAGLNPETVLESITNGAAGSWSLSNLAPRMLKGDFAPGFYVKHFIKDMGIALDSAKQMDITLPALELAERLYQKLAENGGGDNGTQALYKLFDE